VFHPPRRWCRRRAALPRIVCSNRFIGVPPAASLVSQARGIAENRL
jgi:hypothetical protein